MTARAKLAEKWIKGSGIEIGGLHYPVPVPHGIEVTYIDLKPDKDHADVIPEGYRFVVDDAETLETLKDESQDFVIACHVLEHCKGTIHTLRSWARVLRSGGIAMVALPDASQCFDRNRPRTPWVHLLADLHFTDPERQLEHYLDWFLNSELEGKPLDEAAELAVDAYNADRNIHYHCWDAPGIRELFERQQELTGLFIADYCVNGSEVIAILRNSPELLRREA